METADGLSQPLRTGRGHIQTRDLVHVQPRDPVTVMCITTIGSPITIACTTATPPASAHNVGAMLMMSPALKWLCASSSLTYPSI